MSSGRLVAATIRTSTGTSRLLPTGEMRPSLQHAQQLGLHVQREVADLVDEQRAALGRFEPAHPAGDGAREGPLHVAEQLAFDQRLRGWPPC